jgi:hypothetical protein
MSYDAPLMSRSEPQRPDPNPHRRSRGPWLWLVPLLVAAACLLTFTVPHPMTAPRTAKKLDASRAAMTFVKGRFGAEIVLRFAPIDWNGVQHEDNRYVVNGRVEAIRRDGGRSATFDYTCDMSATGKRLEPDEGGPAGPVRRRQFIPCLAPADAILSNSCGIFSDACPYRCAFICVHRRAPMCARRNARVCCSGGSALSSSISHTSI